jgi:hypothetical protein
MEARKFAAAGTAVVLVSLGMMNWSLSQTLPAGEHDIGLVEYKTCSAKPIFSSEISPVGAVTGDREKDNMAYRVTGHAVVCN